MASRSPVQATGRPILLVEDNPNDEALTLRALRKAGVANGVVVARDGAEALELLLGPDETARHGGATLPCVVILDLNLPKVGGLEVLERLRQGEQTRWLPVVVLTSSPEIMSKTAVTPSLSNRPTVTSDMPESSGSAIPPSVPSRSASRRT